MTVMGQTPGFIGDIDGQYPELDEFFDEFDLREKRDRIISSHEMKAYYQYLKLFPRDRVVLEAYIDSFLFLYWIKFPLESSDIDRVYEYFKIKATPSVKARRYLRTLLKNAPPQNRSFDFMVEITRENDVNSQPSGMIMTAAVGLFLTWNLHAFFLGPEQFAYDYVGSLSTVLGIWLSGAVSVAGIISFGVYYLGMITAALFGGYFIYDFCLAPTVLFLWDAFPGLWQGSISFFRENLGSISVPSFEIPVDKIGAALIGVAIGFSLRRICGWRGTRVMTSTVGTQYRTKIRELADQFSQTTASTATATATTSEGPYNQCIGCYDAEVTMAVVPCGHQSFCETCSCKFRESGFFQCPYCQVVITSFIKPILQGFAETNEALPTEVPQRQRYPRCTNI